MDEVYIGGKNKNKHRDKRLEAGRGAVGKQTCRGAKDRASNRIAARPVDLPNQDEVTKLWGESTDCDAKVYTDGSLIYAPVPNHSKVNHSNGEYGRRDLHFNGIESFWSLFKCSIVGAVHQISGKHLDQYIEEIEWRFNNRNNPHLFRDTLRRILTTDLLCYRELVDGRAV